MNKFLLILSFVSFFGLSLFSNSLARLGNVEVSFSEFQDYIDIQKFIFGKNTVDEILNEQKITKNDLLSRYIDQKIILLDAKKNKIDVNNEQVKRRYDNSFKKWISQIYTIKQVGIANKRVNEDDLREVYTKFNQKDNTPFDSLSKEEKSSLYRIVLIERFKGKKEDYQKNLEKKYRVSRKSIDDEVVATVQNRKIFQKDLVAITRRQLANFGVTLEEAQSKDKNQYKQILETARDELIFSELVDIDMERSNFLSRSIVKKALDTYKKQIVVEVFVLNEIVSKAKITDSELDNAFKEISRERPQIKQLLPTQQERVLRSFILQRKQPQLLSSYLSEKKEEIIIKRNKDLLSKVT